MPTAELFDFAWTALESAKLVGPAGGYSCQVTSSTEQLQPAALAIDARPVELESSVNLLCAGALVAHLSEGEVAA